MAEVQRLLAFIKKYSVRFVAAVIMMAIVGASEGLTALLIVPVFDRLLVDAGSGPILLFNLPLHGRAIYLQDFLPHWIHNVWTVVAVSAITITLFKGVAEYFGTYFINFVGLSVVRDLRNLLYARVVAQSMAFFGRNPTGKLMSAITSDTEKVQTAVSRASADLLREIFTLVGLLAVVVYLDWRLSLASLALVPFIIFPSSRIGEYIRHSSRRSQDKMAELNQILQETFSGIRIVKAFVMETFEVGKFKEATRRLLKTNLRMIRADAFTGPLMELLGAVTIVGLLLYERNQILHHVKTTGMFVAFLYALIKMYEPVKRLTGINNQFQQAVGASQQVFHYLDVSSEVADRPGATELAPFEREIVFAHVDFSYEEGVPLLRDVNLRIARGEVVALVGLSGAGKTTLANLIPRFFDVTRGRVLIDGHDVRDVTLKSIRTQIGMVTQETILFNDTVANNIGYGRAVRDVAAMEGAARAALAHDFITEMPQGYETVIGERGQRLSGGQRQRIAIARALLKNPPLLILDEATSELDTESELLVQRALANLMAGRTVLVIAHRLLTVRRADRIVVLDRGTISEIGTHQDLVTRGGIYQRLHELQFVDAEP
jgi:ATP-binding cassette, subfamily B, bacterial MsbA